MDINAAIRPKVLSIYGVAWFVTFTVAIWLNGGLGPIKTLIGALLVGSICGVGAFGLLGSLFSKKLRQVVIRDDFHYQEARKDIMIVGIILLVLSLASFVGAITDPTMRLTSASNVTR